MEGQNGGRTFEVGARTFSGDCNTVAVQSLISLSCGRIILLHYCFPRVTHSAVFLSFHFVPLLPLYLQHLLNFHLSF